MYNIDSRIRYKVTNTTTGKVSGWIDNQVDLIQYITRENNKYPKRFLDLDNSYVRALEYIKSKESYEEKVWYICDSSTDYRCKEVILVKNILIKDNYGRIVGLNELNNVYYDHKEQRYNFNNSLIYYDKPWNKKKKLREKDSGYRREPVRRTGKIKGGSGFRRISYKGTLKLVSDLECKEYGVKGYRTRKIVNAWDIEPWEYGSRSWKENTKAKKQWMIHLDKQDKIIKNNIDMLGMDGIEDIENNKVKHS